MEGSSSNRVPLFDGTNYAFWSRKINTYISSLGYYVFQFVIIGYKVPSTPPMDPPGKKLNDNNAKALISILLSLSNSESVKIMHCET